MEIEQESTEPIVNVMLMVKREMFRTQWRKHLLNEQYQIKRNLQKQCEHQRIHTNPLEMLVKLKNNPIEFVQQYGYDRVNCLNYYAMWMQKSLTLSLSICSDVDVLQNCIHFIATLHGQLHRYTTLLQSQSVVDNLSRTKLRKQYCQLISQITK